MARFSPPEPITPAHELGEFDSGQTTLDEWLRRRALRNEESGASRTYVLCETNSSRVIGYYSLCTGIVDDAHATGSVRRNMPDPIPVMLLGRLAIDTKWQGQGLGRALLRDAVLRTLQAADIAGIRALLVHALSDVVRAYYEKWGFKPSPVDPLTLMIKLSEARKIVSDMLD